MTEPVPPEERPRAALVDGYPEGWALFDESWKFHRQFHFRAGRPAGFGEYRRLLMDVRHDRLEKVEKHAYRATLDDGIVVTLRGSWRQLIGVEPGDWTKPARLPRIWIIPPAPPSKQAREPEPPPPPPAAPKRASTLTLKSPGAAANALNERLRRMGVSA